MAGNSFCLSDNFEKFIRIVFWQGLDEIVSDCEWYEQSGSDVDVYVNEDGDEVVCEDGDNGEEDEDETLILSMKIWFSMKVMNMRR